MARLVYLADRKFKREKYKIKRYARNRIKQINPCVYKFCLRLNKNSGDNLLCPYFYWKMKMHRENGRPVRELLRLNKWLPRNDPISFRPSRRKTRSEKKSARRPEKLRRVVFPTSPNLPDKKRSITWFKNAEQVCLRFVKVNRGAKGSAENKLPDFMDRCESVTCSKLDQ